MSGSDLITIDGINDRYAKGKPLFTRDVLENINRHLEQGEQSVFIPSYVGKGKDHSLTVDEDYRSRCSEDQIPRLGIDYKNIERMTRSMPNGLFRPDRRPVATFSTSITRNLTTMEELQEAFEEYRQEWLASRTRGCLLDYIGDVLTPEQICGITKIVAIGLGALTNPKRSANPLSDIRALVQHAAVRNIADLLKRHNGGREVECYAQDPENDQDVIVHFLRTIGITPLSDPKALLEIDENTFVVSVSPNIPVRQIVCDIARPRVMIWNIVKKEEDKEWRQELIHGELMWVSPYTTDPVSERVVEMVKGYTELPLNNAERWFGEMAMYVRKN